MEPQIEHMQGITRRSFLQAAGRFSLGAIAMASLAGTRAEARRGAGVVNPLAPRKPHFEPKVKRVIYLHMSGGPPHLDLFDYKPELVKWNDKACPDEFLKGRRFAFTSGVPKLMGTPRQFAQYGKGRHLDVRCHPQLAEGRRRFVRHQIAEHRSVQSHPGGIAAVYRFAALRAAFAWVPGSPMGWGRENENLPGFVVLISSGVQPSAGPSAWGSGFLPSVFQGVQCRSKGDPVLFVSDPPGMDRDLRRRSLDALRDLNEAQAKVARPSRNRHAHRPIRTGLSHANLRARGDGHFAGVAADLGRLRRRAGRAELRQ